MGALCEASCIYKTSLNALTFHIDFGRHNSENKMGAIKFEINILKSLHSVALFQSHHMCHHALWHTLTPFTPFSNFNFSPPPINKHLLRLHTQRERERKKETLSYISLCYS